jgi:hypothetical protein
MKVIACLVSLLFIAGAAAAQDTQAPPPGGNLYQVTITFHQLEGGKRVSSRSVEMTAPDGEKVTFRQGSRVPYQTSPPSTNYAEVGTTSTFACRHAARALWLRQKSRLPIRTT